MNLPLALILSDEAQRRYFAEGQSGRRAAQAQGQRKVSRRRRRAQID